MLWASTGQQALHHERLSVDCQVLGLGFDGKGDFKLCDMIIFAFQQLCWGWNCWGGGAGSKIGDREAS